MFRFSAIASQSCVKGGSPRSGDGRKTLVSELLSLIASHIDETPFVLGVQSSRQALHPGVFRYAHKRSKCWSPFARMVQVMPRLLSSSRTFFGSVALCCLSGFVFLGCVCCFFVCSFLVLFC